MLADALHAIRKLLFFQTKVFVITGASGANGHAAEPLDGLLAPNNPLAAAVVAVATVAL